MFGHEFVELALHERTGNFQVGDGEVAADPLASDSIAIHPHGEDQVFSTAASAINLLGEQFLGGRLRWRGLGVGFLRHSGLHRKGVRGSGFVVQGALVIGRWSFLFLLTPDY